MKGDLRSSGLGFSSYVGLGEPFRVSETGTRPGGLMTAWARTPWNQGNQLTEKSGGWCWREVGSQSTLISF